MTRGLYYSLREQLSSVPINDMLSQNLARELKTTTPIMKLQVFASVASVLFAAVPGVFSEVSTL